MLEDIDGILFDFDGTLAPNLDLPDMRRQVVELTLGNGVPPDVFADQYIVEIVEVSHDFLALRDRTKAAKYAEQAHKLIRDIELRAAAKTQVFEVTRPLLAKLRQHNLRQAVVTRNCAPAVVQSFPDWADYVDALFARDQVAKLKPDPGHFVEALDTLNCVPTRAAIVSDGAMDMRTGKALGLRCIGVLTGSSNEDQLLSAGADSVLSDIAALSVST